MLSPAYDVVPSAQGLGYQAMLGDNATESTLVNSLSQSRQFGLKADAARNIVKAMCSSVANWKKAFKSKGVAKRDIDLFAQYIDGDRLRQQRDEFSG
jgi:serine/threonine-protein kinase HipA